MSDQDFNADIARAAPCGLALLDADFRLVWVNDYLAGLLAIPTGALAEPASLAGFFTPASRIFLQTRLQQEVSTGADVEELALDLLGAGGLRTPVMLSASRDAASGSKRIRLAVSRAPVRRAYEAEVPKARMAADLAQAAARAIIEGFVRHCPVPLVMTDGSLMITGVSGAWETAYGQVADTVIGRRIDEREGGDPDSDNPWSAVYAKALAGESLRGDVPVRSVLTDMWFEWAAIPWRDATGEVGGLLLINFDVTDLIRARDAAAAADEAKTRFLANMSHEMRTPLNSVLAPVELLRMLDLPEAAKAHLATVADAGVQLTGLLTNLLDFSQIEAGAFEIRTGPVDLAALCDEVLETCRDTARDKSLVVTGPEEVGERAIISDGMALRRILALLLSNAVKFTSSGEVCLRVAFEQNHVVFTVSDTGCGFDDAVFDELLEPFAQVDASATRRFGGVGLGLALAQALTRALGGTLSATSAPGLGSHVSLHAPLVWGEALAEQAPHGSEAVPESLRILAVDDNPANLAVLGAILQIVDADVIFATDGAEAVAQAISNRFDLILMDVQMPVMDGLSAIRAIRAHERGEQAYTPIIVVSANVSRPEADAAVAAGADHVLGKPIQAATLIDAMDQTLRGVRAAA